MSPLAAAVPSRPVVAAPGWRRALAFVGPGYLVAVGYMDPGNWAVDLAGGASAGFALLSVVLSASLVAMLLQALVVRLTLETGRDLATLIRERLPRPVSLAVWAVSEVAIVATELAELIGGAVAFKLLLGLPLAAGATLTAAITLLALARPMAAVGGPERLVTLLFAAVAAGLAVQLALVRPDPGAVLAGLVPDPALARDPHLVTLALGILGATVMPHNLYLHSGLVRDRLQAGPAHDPALARRVALTDMVVALTLAFLVNAAILVLSASVFHGTDAAATVGLESAPGLMAGMLGSGLAALLFAVTLLAAGQSATITGAMAGQIVMAGLLGVTLPAWLRVIVMRGAALALALAAILLGDAASGDHLLIASQVVLSLALPAVLVPLALLVSARRPAAARRPGRLSRAGAWGFALGLTGLNLALLPGLLAG